MVLLLPIGGLFLLGSLPSLVTMLLPGDSEWLPWALIGWGLSVLLFLILICFPLLHGLLYLSHRICEREEATLADLFISFSSAREYGAALGRSALAALRLTAVLLSCLFWELLCFFVFGEVAWAESLCRGVELCTLTLALLLWAKRFLHPHLTLVCPAGERRALLDALRAGGISPVRLCLRYFWGFAPWLLLGALTFGILPLADTLPRMLLSYELLCREVRSSTQHAN